MASFLDNQLDFIFFFYGMAFMLLGATCSAVARGQGGGEVWAVLGVFGFVHGVGEWLDLTALIVGDTPAFAIARLVVMTASFVLLVEFARLKAIRLGLQLPGRWIDALLCFVVALVGATEGVNVAGIVARYTIGFGGALGASLALAWSARSFSGASRGFALSASAAFAFYAVAAGIMVPAGPFWPSTVINYGAFDALTGMPIQLVRGLLACWIAFSVWAVWSQRLASDISSPRYTAYLRKQFIWTLVALGVILLSGWTLTEYLGGIYRQNVQKDAGADIDLLASRLNGETATVEAMVRSLAGSPSVLPLLAGGGRQDFEAGQSVLDLDVEASGAKRGYILNDSENLVASSGQPVGASGLPFHMPAPWFSKSMAGAPDFQFVYDPGTGKYDYHASYPIRAADRSIVGVAVLVKSLDSFEMDLRAFGRPYFLVNPDGVVVMTNRPDAMYRSLWPLSEAKQTSLARRIASGRRPMLEGGIIDASWMNVDGERNYVRRRFANHSDWSLVILKPTREIFATRFLGIVITLLVTIMTLIYLLGKGRLVHDGVLLDNRLKLQKLAQDLRVKATTDPLTGLYNRFKLGPILIDEMQRVDRYDTPLSLVLFDIDHFKQINDTHGHLVGDQVLVQLSGLALKLIRSSDFLARWGGEEFLIVVPGSDRSMAFHAAEKLRDAIGQAAFDDVGSVTCSFGVAQYARGETTDDFVTRADAALYRAKSSGRNQVKLAPQPDPKTEIFSRRG
jgi:diguanylate cyclase (GGDEF)-like protein